MRQGLPRYDLPVPVCPGWGGRSRSLPLMLLLSLHGSFHLQPEYYANWTRCLQSMSLSLSLSLPLLLLTWQKQQLLIIHSALMVELPLPLPLLPPLSFSLSINLFKTQDSQLILSTGLSSSFMLFHFFSTAQYFLRFPGVQFPPFFLLPECTPSPSLC